MTEATLMTHAGATRMTRQELRGIPAPLSTPTHRPIAHGDLIETLDDRLQAAGYKIVREQFAVMRQGLMLFGTFDLENGHVSRPGTGLAMGFRHSNDKHVALSIVAGVRVFLCDNGAMIGDVRLFKNKHTHGVISRLRDSLGGFFGTTLKQEYATIDARIDRWN